MENALRSLLTLLLALILMLLFSNEAEAGRVGGAVNAPGGESSFAIESSLVGRPLPVVR